MATPPPDAPLHLNLKRIRDKVKGYEIWLEVLKTSLKKAEDKLKLNLTFTSVKDLKEKVVESSVHVNEALEIEERIAKIRALQVTVEKKLATCIEKSTEALEVAVAREGVRYSMWVFKNSQLHKRNSIVAKRGRTLAAGYAARYKPVGNLVYVVRESVVGNKWWICYQTHVRLVEARELDANAI